MSEHTGTSQEQLEDNYAANEATAEAYLMDLGLNWDMLEDKKVLDIGAGLAGFAQAAKKRGINVVSLDAHPEWWSEIGDPPTDVPFVIGDGKKLPFKDGSFDVIVARAAIHSMVEVLDELEAVICESKRVLKPGGELRIGPGNIAIRAVREAEWDKWFELLDKVRNKQTLNPEEDEWGAKVWPAYEREQEEYEELIGLSHEERIKKMEERSFTNLKRIEPSITEHIFIREVNWKGKVEQFPSVYYVMKKPSKENEV